MEYTVKIPQMTKQTSVQQVIGIKFISLHIISMISLYLHKLVMIILSNMGKAAMVLTYSLIEFANYNKIILAFEPCI